jgi:AraC family transcriptional regulator, transcriptional activator of pobA
MTIQILNFNRPDEKNIDFEMITASKSSLPNAPDKPHRHNFYEILVVKQSFCTHIIDFKTYTINNHELLIIPKNSVHSSFATDQYDGIWLLFGEGFFTPEQSKTLFRMSIFNPVIDNKLIDLNFNLEIYTYLDIIEKEHEEIDDNYLILQNLLFSFLLKLERLAQEQYPIISPKSERNIYIEFMTLLEKYFKSEHSVSFYAEELHITPKKLNEFLSKSTGKTTNDIILERLMVEAKRLLIYSENSVKEIAFDLGYEDNHYFSRIFKKKTNFSPEHFKKIHA